MNTDMLRLIFYCYYYLFIFYMYLFTYLFIFIIFCCCKLQLARTEQQETKIHQVTTKMERSELTLNVIMVNIFMVICQ